MFMKHIMGAPYKESGQKIRRDAGPFYGMVAFIVIQVREIILWLYLYETLNLQLFIHI